METPLTADQFIEQLRSLIKKYKRERNQRAKEHFEYLRILLPDAAEVSEFRGEWKRYFQRNRTKMERCIYALHYYSLAAANPERIPWKPIPAIAGTGQTGSMTNKAQSA